MLNARDAAARGADIRVRTEVTERAPRGQALAHLTLRERRRRRDASRRRRDFLVNVGGPLGRRGHPVGAMGAQRGPPHPPRPGLAHRHAQALRPRPGLHLPERRQPHHLRHPLRGRLHPGRHHRPGLTRASPAQRRSPRARSTISSRPPASISRTPLTRADIVWTYSGVRPLYDDGASKAQEATRDYVLKVEGDTAAASPPCSTPSAARSPPTASSAEEVLERIGERIGAAARPGRARQPLPGGDFPIDGVAALEAQVAAAAPEARSRARSAGSCAPTASMPSRFAGSGATRRRISATGSSRPRSTG